MHDDDESVVANQLLPQHGVHRVRVDHRITTYHLYRAYTGWLPAVTAVELQRPFNRYANYTMRLSFAGRGIRVFLIGSFILAFMMKFIGHSDSHGQHAVQ